LEPVLNRLFDLEKLTGGSAEMFWRGARPGYQGKVHQDYQMTDSEAEDLQDQIDEFEHNLRRILINEGVDLESLEQQVADPQNHVSIQLDMICAVTGIPKRILIGSERGELASTEDRDNWFDYVTSRRQERAEPLIIRPLVERLIEYRILPPYDEEYTVDWSSLWEQSEEDKAKVGKTRAEALKSYTASPANLTVLPPEAFYKFGLGLDESDVEWIEELQDGEIDAENIDFGNQPVRGRGNGEEPEEEGA
jgi:hypothetical protein